MRYAALIGVIVVQPIVSSRMMLDWSSFLRYRITAPSLHRRRRRFFCAEHVTMGEPEVTIRIAW